MKLDPFRVEAAAVDLAHTIALEGPFNAPRSVDEVMRELFLAIISSRVRWEVACAIVEDLLSIVRSSRTTGLHEAVQSAAARHRHPRQVARWVEVLLAENGRMLNRALRTAAMQEEPGLVRRHLIAEVVGLGPKQASLFLRNVGRGHRLAVLDRHVVRFMHLLGISATGGPVASIAAYERMEAAFVAYADYRRVSANALDLAVWVVMRTATGRIVREHRDAGFGWARFNPYGRTCGGGGADAVSSLH